MKRARIDAWTGPTGAAFRQLKFNEFITVRFVFQPQLKISFHAKDAEELERVMD